MAVSMVSNVAGLGIEQYTADMSKPRDPDIITASQAMELLGVRTKPTFYTLLERIKRETGVDLRNLANPWSKRAYYRRSQILELLREQESKRTQSDEPQ